MSSGRTPVLWRVSIPIDVIEAFEDALPKSSVPRVQREIKLEEEVTTRLGISNIGDAAKLVAESSPGADSSAIQTVPPVYELDSDGATDVLRYAVDEEIRRATVQVVEESDTVATLDEYIERVMRAYATGHPTEREFLCSVRDLTDEKAREKS